MKYIFIGCVESSYLFLEKLINMEIDIVGVITKEMSSFNADFRDLTGLCEQANIDYLLVNNINQENSIEFIKSKKPDMGFCLGWSQLIKADVIDLFPKGIVGFHPAELPFNRGRHPIIWALALGLDETASSFFLIDKKADTGDILSQEKLKISYGDNAASLYKKIMMTAIQQLEELCIHLEHNTCNPIKQSLEVGNSWRKRSEKDGEIDWRMSSYSIYNLVRALNKPYVGAHMVYQEKKYKIWKVCEVFGSGDYNIEPGKVLEVYADGSFDVKVADNVIRILECDKINVKKGEYL